MAGREFIAGRRKPFVLSQRRSWEEPRGGGGEDGRLQEPITKCYMLMWNLRKVCQKGKEVMKGGCGREDWEEVGSREMVEGEMRKR